MLSVFQNVDLIRMFLREGTNELMPILRTGLCQDIYLRLKAAIYNAERYGIVEVYTIAFFIFCKTGYFEIALKYLVCF